MMTLYHGLTEIVKYPKCICGRDNLDFGKGFYLTDIKEQAYEQMVRELEVFCSGLEDVVCDVLRENGLLVE